MVGGSSSSSSPSLVDSLFQRSLDDLIRSLRSAPPAAEHLAISRALDEIRREIRSSDADTKSVALSKLTYLSSLHHIDPSWAAFHALELLPSSSLPVKRSAYLFASLYFHPSTTPVLPLATNQLRKDLTSPSASLALHLISSASSPDLASHLSSDLHALLSTSRPQTRRQALAASLPVISLSPESAPVALPRLVEALSDPRAAPSAVGVFCELSASDPRAYLPLAPEFYRILVDCRNNWTLIKVLKIFARLALLEPRISRRIVDPICDHMRRSHAKSLVFECVRTVFCSLSDHDAAVRLAVEKIREGFLAAADDPNLRFLGLQALSMLGPQHSWAIEENREVVIRSLDDPDPNIRGEALRLIAGMVSENNVIEISELLVKYALRSDPEFRNKIFDAILLTCGRNVYELIVDFDWYVSLLGHMARSPECSEGDEIGRQIVDIGLRVRDARLQLVRVARDLLIDPALLGNPLLTRILSAAAWVSGEYVEFSRNLVELVEALLQPRTHLLPTLVRAVYIQALLKVIVHCFSSYIEQAEAGYSSTLGTSNHPGAHDETDFFTGLESENGDVDYQEKSSLSGSLEKKEPFTHDTVVYILNLVETSLAQLSDCNQAEVQERARNVLGLINMFRKIHAQNTDEGGLKQDERFHEIVKGLQDVFSDKLGPVSLHAQQNVSVPEGLVLKENLSDLAAVLSDEDTVPSASISFSLRSNYQNETKINDTTSAEPSSLHAEHRKRHGLFYIPTEERGNESHDYPRANESTLPDSHSATTDYLMKLTKQSLIPRKDKSTKSRPVVVKLEEGEGSLISVPKPAKEPRDHLLSDAIQKVGLGNERRPENSLKKSSDRSQRKVKDGSINSQHTSQLNEGSNSGEQKPGRSSSSSKHHKHVKDRHRSPQKNDDNEGKSHRNSARSAHHHGRDRHKQKDVPLDVIPQPSESESMEVSRWK